MLDGLGGAIENQGAIVVMVVLRLLPMQSRVSLSFGMLAEGALLTDDHGLPEHDGEKGEGWKEAAYCADHCADCDRA